MTRSNFSPFYFLPEKFQFSEMAFLLQVVEENKRLSEKMTGLAEEVERIKVMFVS